MTLIAAWITPKFRIIASDSRLTNKFGISINEDCQKIFVSNNLAIGLFGGFDIPFNLFKVDKLLKGVMRAENWDLDKFRSELSKYLENRHIPNSGENKESNILVVSRNDEAFVLRFQSDRKIEEFKLIDYKSIHQKYLPPDLFFSEQILNNGGIDFQHQKSLTKQFENSKQSTEFDCNNITNESLVKLFQDFYSAVYYEGDLQKEVIGGNKIYLAYCFNNENWRQIDLKPIPYDTYIKQ